MCISEISTDGILLTHCCVFQPRMEPIFDHMQVPSEEGSTLHENGAHVVAAKPTSEEWEKYIDTKFKYEDGTEGTSKVHKLFK